MESLHNGSEKRSNEGEKSRIFESHQSEYERCFEAWQLAALRYPRQLYEGCGYGNHDEFSLTLARDREAGSGSVKRS
jgi:hypothetical protein